MKHGHDKYLKVNDVSIRYRELGDGFPLLLVHGIAGFLEEWEMSIEPLSKHYRVIALDLPGHGLSDKPKIPYSIDRLTGFLKEFTEEMKLEKFHLVGHSLGGGVCLNFVIKFGTLVEKLIVVNSAFTKLPIFCRFSSFRFLQKINIKVPIYAIKVFTRKTFFNRNAIAPSWFNNAYTYINTPGALRTVFSITHESMSLSGLKKELVEAFQDGLSKIEIPVLIVYGNKDALISNENSFMLHELINNSEIRLVQDCGHALQHEKSHEFCDIAIQFLQ